MHELKLLLLLIIANGTPILAHKLLGNKWDVPLDARLRFIDGRALLGSSKTLRGVILSILITAMVAPLFELTVVLGALLAFYAMCGDLFSSFLKRRLNMPPSSMVRYSMPAIVSMDLDSFFFRMPNASVAFMYLKACRD